MRLLWHCLCLSSNNSTFWYRLSHCCSWSSPTLVHHHIWVCVCRTSFGLLCWRHIFLVFIWWCRFGPYKVWLGTNIQLYGEASRYRDASPLKSYLSSSCFYHYHPWSGSFVFLSWTWKMNQSLRRLTLHLYHSKVYLIMSIDRKPHFVWWSVMISWRFTVEILPFFFLFLPSSSLVWFFRFPFLDLEDESESS